MRFRPDRTANPLLKICQSSNKFEKCRPIHIGAVAVPIPQLESCKTTMQKQFVADWKRYPASDALFCGGCLNGSVID